MVKKEARRKSLQQNIDFLSDLAGRILDHGDPEVSLYFNDDPVEEVPKNVDLDQDWTCEFQVCARSPEVISETVWQIAQKEHENIFTRHILCEFIDTAIPVCVSIIKDCDISEFSQDTRNAITRILQMEGHSPWRDGLLNTFQEYCSLARDYFTVESEYRDIIDDTIEEELMSVQDDSYYFGFKIDKINNNVNVSLCFAHHLDAYNKYSLITDLDFDDFMDHKIFTSLFSEKWNHYLPLDKFMTNKVEKFNLSEHEMCFEDEEEQGFNPAR